MSHFNKKYFSQIGGAGKPKKPDPPPPPTLNPPKLGDLQAISSYEYVESIDLMSDGPIEGFVNQNGEYLEDARMFEAIYVNDVPIKQTVTIDTGVYKFSYSLEPLMSQLSGFFYDENGQYKNPSITNPPISASINLVSGHGTISCALLPDRLQFATAMQSSLNEINLSTMVNTSTASIQSNDLKNYYQNLKNGKYNFGSANEILTNLFPLYPGQTEQDNTIVCLQLKLSIDTSPNSKITPTPVDPYVFNSMDFVHIEDDIFNQVFMPFEAEELQSKARFVPGTKRKLNLTRPIINGWQGSIFIFAYKDGDSLYETSAKAIIESLKSIKLIEPISKYNIANASFEFRNGDELQKPLNSFRKSYVDKNYSFKLTGPFAKGRPISRLPRIFSGTNEIGIDTSFLKDYAGGIRPYSEMTNTNPLISADQLKSIQSTHSIFFSPSNAAVGPALKKYKDLIKNEGGPVTFKTFYYNSNTNVIEFHFLYSQYIGGYYFDPKLISSTNVNGQVYLPQRYATTESWFSFNLTTNRFVSNAGRPANAHLTTKTRYYDINNNVYYTKIVDSELFTNINDPINNANKFTLSARFQRFGMEQYIFRQSDRDLFSLDFKEWSQVMSEPVVFDYIIVPIIAACFEKATEFEGSDDDRLSGNKAKSFSDWNKDYIAYTNEQARPFVHVIQNPSVTSLFVTIGVRVLRDTADDENYQLKKATGNPDKVPIGTTIPSIVRFIIECGYQNPDGTEELLGDDSDNPYEYPKIYEIRGVCESPATIDIGRVENEKHITKYSRFIMGSSDIAKPLTLPPAVTGKIRFVRIRRLTYESFSTLIKREIFLEKVTEIIDTAFSYPFSAVCGLKLDARSSSEIPSRSYDARYKKVFVPTNYFPLLPSGKDKRYLTKLEFNNATTKDKTIYQGNWDGRFKFAWTDNPVWILFDILINTRYGLGNFISPTQINYWELYKIGRYCDAVDNNGVFQGVPDESGGYEPRYAFNGVIGDKTNVFDVLKTIISCFRGNMFYSNSEINFTNDRLKPIMSFFNNANVKDGMFTYTNDRRDLQYNIVEVSFLDRTDYFKQKIEYVENPEDIKNRGALRSSAQTFGVTSRSHARRLGKHILYSSVNENQNVQFIAGLETLLCRPGDLIAINDELRALKKHVGRVLDVNLTDNSIYTNIDIRSNNFNSSGLTGELTVLIPTGKISLSEFYDLSKSPSALNISEVYKNDIPMSVTLVASTTGFTDYGSTFFIDPACSGISLLKDLKIGTPCTITLSNIQQEIYKIASIKEMNLNEYEVIATKFDTGKFGEIESDNNLNDFFEFFPQSRTGQVHEGSYQTIEQENLYQLEVPTIFNLSYSEPVNNLTNLTASFYGVGTANCYDVELITPKSKVLKKRIDAPENLAVQVDVSFNNQSEVGVYTAKLTARTTGVYPNLISPTISTTSRVVSYVGPIRSNAIISNFKIDRSIKQ